jgi:hypothetical protein
MPASRSSTHGDPAPGPLPQRPRAWAGQALAGVKDPVLRNACIEIFNDSRAEIQSRTNNRLLPMPILPAWDVEGCVREAQRISELGLCGG